MSNVFDNVFATRPSHGVGGLRLRYGRHVTTASDVFGDSGDGRVTITDVARSVGVSVATVSKVVNGRYGVAPGTIARVQAAIAELGYETSLVARSMRGQSTGNIGVLVSEFESYSTELLKGISEAVAGTGYGLLAYAGRRDDVTEVGWERRSLSRLARTLFDGAIVVTPSTLITGSFGIPIVAVDPHSGPEGPHTVDSDNRTGARLATEHLLALGHRRIGLLGGREDLESARMREAGWREALDAAGVAPDPALVRVVGYRPDLAEQAARELLALPADVRPTAIFAANDRSALPVLEVAAEFGIRVPHDLSVIGYDDIPEAAIASPPLTTIAQPLHDMGRSALTLMLDLLEGRETERHLRLPTRLVERSTTAPLARR
ncbi:LacI family transcriptional regulator [Agrococcus jenensis]|uniref:LacI family transcriptional regulator n=1 Tax=Agrococcus jenensis TaxID=46353 RepID=A0A3N2APR7_9MICO|nr:LacI family transcriptional regulator [Agrococcus jenensis]